MECRDIADWPDPSLMHLPEDDARRGDLAIFLTELMNGKFWTPWDDDTDNLLERTTCHKDRKPYIARNSHALAVAVGEVKLDHPAFGDTSFLLVSLEAEQTRGQIIDYATEIMLRQHRCFVYVFYVYRATARLMRVDRTGAMVTKIINLATEPEVFYEFFYRLKDASDVELGFDPTASIVVEAEDDSVDSRAKPLRDALDAALRELDPDSRVTPYIERAFNKGETKWPLYKLDVPSKDGQRSFLVRNLSTSSVSPTGRATKGYIAFDIQEKVFCFLKDYWRPDSDAVHSEMEIYAKFESLGEDKKIAGIATVRCGGDLCLPGGGGLQVTRTQDFGQSSHLRLIHTRLVLNEIGIPLKDYKNAKELCSVVLYAFKGESLHLCAASSFLGSP